MKLLMTILLVATLFSCDTSVKKAESSPDKTEMDLLVALKVLNSYTANCNALKDAGKWVENQELLTEEFKKDYQKMMKEAWEDDPEMGLGFDPVFNAQDYPEKGFKFMRERRPENSKVDLQGIDSDLIVTVRLKEVNGKWLVDGMGVIRMPK
jgi:hypothetical protein